MDLDWATTSGWAISASVGSKAAASDADTTVDLLVGVTKPGYSMWKSRILRKNIPNYTENWKITPNLITDQSTLRYCNERRGVCEGME